MPRPSTNTAHDRVIGQMTPRARVYLTIAAGRHLLTGGFILTAPDLFVTAAFIPIIKAAPLWAWGLMFLGSGLVCATAGLRKSEGAARLGLVLSATSTGMVGVGLLLAAISQQASPLGSIVFLAVAAKDLTVCTDPLRSPFEALAQRIHHDGD